MLTLLIIGILINIETKVYYIIVHDDTVDRHSWAACVDGQAGMHLCYSHAAKSGFLAMRPLLPTYS